MKHVLLTGATGFLGSHLLEALLVQGYQVTILKRSTSDTWRIKHLLDSVVAFDVDVQPLEEAFKTQKFDAVIHTACSYGRSGEPAHSVAETNLIFGLRLLDAATSYNSRVFFNTDSFFSSSNALSEYLGSYSLSKKQFSEWLRSRASKINVANMRLQHIYGPKDDKGKFIPWLIDQLIVNAVRIPLTEGNQLRDFIYVDDVVSAYMCCLENLDQIHGFSEFDVGSGELIKVREFVKRLHEVCKEKNKNLITELGFGDIPMSAGELMGVSVDLASLNKLGWTPKSDGIRKLVEWVFEND